MLLAPTGGTICGLGPLIFANVAKDLGLPVSTDMPKEIVDLMTLTRSPCALRAAALNIFRFHAKRPRVRGPIGPSSLKRPPPQPPDR